MNLPGRTLAPPWNRRLSAAFGSLKLRITLSAVGALVLGIGLTTALLVRQAERDTLSSSRHRELNETVRTAALLSQRVVDLQRALQAGSSQLDPLTLSDPARLAAFMNSQSVLRGLFSSLFVATADGRMRLYADGTGVRPLDGNVLEREYFRRTIAEQRAIVSEPVAGKLVGEPLVVLTYPLRADGKVYGALAGTLRLASRGLLDDLVDGVDAENTGLVVVTDARGHILAHRDRTLLMRSLATEPRLAQAYAEWVGSGAAVEPAGLRLTQPDEVVSGAGVAGPDWMVWRALPEAELLAPLRVARQHTLAWAGALIGLLSLAMLAWLWWLLRPLTQLEHRAEHLFDTSLDPQTGWPAAGGEIGKLARVLSHVGTERAQLEAANTQVMRRLGSVMSAAPVGIAFTQSQKFELVSTEFCRLFGRTEADMLGQPTRMIYASNADYETVGPQVIKAFKAGLPYMGEWEMLRADGTHFWARLRGRPVDGVDSQGGTIWTINDIGEQITARTQLEWSASHDVLTGLANRKALDARLARVFEAMPRSMPAAVVMIDLDHFKPINDNAGHAAGDAMLKLVAAAIMACVRTSDLVVRQGGDEFVLLLERCSTEVALRIAENVRAAITDIQLPWQQQLLRVGASVGVAPLAAEIRDATTWVAAADAACYRAKAEGRNAVRLALRPLLGVEGQSGEIEAA